MAEYKKQYTKTLLAWFLGSVVLVGCIAGFETAPTTTPVIPSCSIQLKNHAMVIEFLGVDALNYCGAFTDSGNFYHVLTQPEKSVICRLWNKATEINNATEITVRDLGMTNAYGQHFCDIFLANFDEFGAVIPELDIIQVDLEELGE